MGEWDNYWEALNGGELIEVRLGKGLNADLIDIAELQYQELSSEERMKIKAEVEKRREEQRRQLISEYELEKQRIKLEGYDISFPDASNKLIYARSYIQDGTLEEVISKYEYLLKLVLEVEIKVEKEDNYVFKVSGQDDELEKVCKLFTMADIDIASERRIGNIRISIMFFHGFYRFENLIKRSIEHHKKKNLALKKRQEEDERKRANLPENVFKQFIEAETGIEINLTPAEDNFIIGVNRRQQSKIVSFLEQEKATIIRQQNGVILFSPPPKWYKKLNKNQKLK